MCRLLFLLTMLMFVLLTACGDTAAQPAEVPSDPPAAAALQPDADPSANEAPATPVPEPRDQPLNVVATTGQVADALRNIAGDVIELTELLGPGIDPHTYVPTEGDIDRLSNADVIFYNGLYLEAQMKRVLEQLGSQGNITVVAVAEQLDPLTLLNWEPEEGEPFDPHVWKDVRLWIQVVQIIRDTLAEVDPANAEVFEQNTAAYIKELEDLHTYILEQVQLIPQERRVLVTAHDAFHYFGRAYGFAVDAVQGISTETEASTADIQALANTVVAREVPAIFIETTISPRTIEAVKEAVRAEGFEVEIGGELYSDALGEPGTQAETYIGMMRHNIDTIVAALGEAS